MKYEFLLGAFNSKTSKGTNEGYILHIQNDD